MSTAKWQNIAGSKKFLILQTIFFERAWLNIVDHAQICPFTK
jgi:hypothetical protein